MLQCLKAFQAELKEILDAPWQAMKEEGKDPLVAPPIYGRWQAARHTVNITPVPPATLTWLDELNLDPRHRAVAALGTQVVQTQQEQLMASAWEQLGEIERINQIRRQAQLGRAVNAVYYARHFKQFSPETLLKVVASAQSRVVVEATDANNVKTRAMLSHRISESAIPVRAVSAPLRRLTNPRGVTSTRFQTVGAPPIGIVTTLNTFTPIVALHKREAGLVTINQVSDQAGGLANPLKDIVRFEKVSNVLDTTPSLHFTISAEGDAATLLKPFIEKATTAQDSPDQQAFRKAAKELQDYLILKAFISFKTAPAPPMKLSDTKDALLLSVNPETTIDARVRASLTLATGTGQTGDPLEPIMDAPEFPQPMYEAVRDLSQDFLFPGLEHVLPNTIALLETNPKFVESFLVGLNAEMSHELLWRGYPTDQRGTYFQQFWDTSAGNDQPPDIDLISKWGDHKLGANARKGGKLVLLVRGELLRRYPNSVIYAVRAVKTGGLLDLSRDPKHELPPLFRGTLKPDVTFLGFDLTKDEARADPGWFFVIQQQPTEPRFGLDAEDFKKPPPSLTAPGATWNDLSWQHLANTEGELKALSHASIKTVLPVIDNVEWGKNSAHQAYITLQRPVRVAIHAKEMI